MTAAAETNPFTFMDDALLAEITQWLDAHAEDSDVEPQIKARWPGYRFVFCSEDDMDMKPPFQEQKKYDLFLIAAGFGCATFALDTTSAIGLVIALREPE